MSNGEGYFGSLCITDLLAKLNEKHSAFTQGRNGKIYCNINLWVNPTDDQYGNRVGIQLSSAKDKRDVEKKFYIGNAKKSEYSGSKPLDDQAIANVQKNFSGAISQEGDGLPFSPGRMEAF